MSQLCNIDAQQLVLSATAIAISLSKLFKGDDLNILSGLFVSIGDLLAVIAAREACNSADAQQDSRPGEAQKGAAQEEPEEPPDARTNQTVTDPEQLDPGG